MKKISRKLFTTILIGSGFITLASCGAENVTSILSELGDDTTTITTVDDTKTEDNTTTTTEAHTHTYGDAVYTWNGKSCTATKVCACGKEPITETVEATYVKDSEATLTSHDKGHYVAAFTNEAFVTQSTDANSVEGTDPFVTVASVAINEEGKLAAKLSNDDVIILAEINTEFPEIEDYEIGTTSVSVELEDGTTISVDYESITSSDYEPLQLHALTIEGNEDEEDYIVIADANTNIYSLLDKTGFYALLAYNYEACGYRLLPLDTLVKDIPVDESIWVYESESLKELSVKIVDRNIFADNLTFAFDVANMNVLYENYSLLYAYAGDILEEYKLPETATTKASIYEEFYRLTAQIVKDCSNDIKRQLLKDLEELIDDKGGSIYDYYSTYYSNDAKDYTEETYAYLEGLEEKIAKAEELSLYELSELLYELGSSEIEKNIVLSNQLIEKQSQYITYEYFVKAGILSEGVTKEEFEAYLKEKKYSLQTFYDDDAIYSYAYELSAAYNYKKVRAYAEETHKEFVELIDDYYENTVWEIKNDLDGYSLYELSFDSYEGYLTYIHKRTFQNVEFIYDLFVKFLDEYLPEKEAQEGFFGYIAGDTNSYDVLWWDISDYFCYEEEFIDDYLNDYMYAALLDDFADSDDSCDDYVDEGDDCIDEDDDYIDEDDDYIDPYAQPTLYTLYLCSIWQFFVEYDKSVRDELNNQYEDYNFTAEELGEAVCMKDKSTGYYLYFNWDEDGYTFDSCSSLRDVDIDVISIAEDNSIKIIDVSIAEAYDKVFTFDMPEDFDTYTYGWIAIYDKHYKKYVWLELSEYEDVAYYDYNSYEVTIDKSWNVIAELDGTSIVNPILGHMLLLEDEMEVHEDSLYSIDDVIATNSYVVVLGDEYYKFYYPDEDILYTYDYYWDYMEYLSDYQWYFIAELKDGKLLITGVDASLQERYDFIDKYTNAVLTSDRETTYYYSFGDDYAVFECTGQGKDCYLYKFTGFYDGEEEIVVNCELEDFELVYLPTFEERVKILFPNKIPAGELDCSCITIPYDGKYLIYNLVDGEYVFDRITNEYSCRDECIAGYDLETKTLSIEADNHNLMEKIDLIYKTNILGDDYGPIVVEVVEYTHYCYEDYYAFYKYVDDHYEFEGFGEEFDKRFYSRVGISNGEVYSLYNRSEAAQLQTSIEYTGDYETELKSYKNVVIYTAFDEKYRKLSYSVARDGFIAEDVVESKSDADVVVEWDGESLSITQYSVAFLNSFNLTFGDENVDSPLGVLGKDNLCLTFENEYYSLSYDVENKHFIVGDEMSPTSDTIIVTLEDGKLGYTGMTCANVKDLFQDKIVLGEECDEVGYFKFGPFYVRLINDGGNISIYGAYENDDHILSQSCELKISSVDSGKVYLSHNIRRFNCGLSDKIFKVENPENLVDGNYIFVTYPNIDRYYATFVYHSETDTATCSVSYNSYSFLKVAPKNTYNATAELRDGEYVIIVGEKNAYSDYENSPKLTVSDSSFKYTENVILHSGDVGDTTHRILEIKEDTVLTISTSKELANLKIYKEKENGMLTEVDSVYSTDSPASGDIVFKAGTYILCVTTGYAGLTEPFEYSYSICVKTE